MTTGIRKSYVGAFAAMAILFCVSFLSSCSTSRHVARNSHRPVERKELKVDYSGMTSRQKKIVKEAISWLDTPYKYGGNEKGKGADCSGMVLEVYLKTCNVKLPRNSANQADFCKKIKRKNVVPGDLVFFATGKDEDKISHVGIMINETDFIHSSTSKGVVVSNVDTPYYVRTFKMYGKVP